MRELQDRYFRLMERILQALHRSGRDLHSLTLVAVSKGRTVAEIRQAYALGIRHFGENYVQEFLSKYTNIPANQYSVLQWHFIGHLQRNKAKQIIGKVALLHSVDNLQLAQKLSSRAAANNLQLPILLQVNTSGESSKFGCSPEELFPLAESIVQLPNLTLRGLMTLAAYVEPPEKTRPMFALLRKLRDQLEQLLPEYAPFPELSMGMSHDFEIAIEEGATIIRIGSALFGPRPYKQQNATTVSSPTQGESQQ